MEGKYRFDSVDGIISGKRDKKGVNHLHEGQHGMNAALEILEETGDPQYVHELIKNAERVTLGRIWLENGDAPALPRRTKKWWEKWTK